MFQEAIKSLTSFQASIDRLAKAIEDLKQTSNSDPKPEHTAEKKSSPKPKKDTSKESAAPASSPEKDIAAKPADGSSTASPAAPKAPEVPTTPPAPKDEEDDFGTTPAPKIYTDVDVRNAAIKCAAVLKTDEKAKEIIKTIGNSPNIKSMDPSKYAAVMAAFEEAMKGK